ncbi:MAG: vWA domain-containing protein [Candidatus Aenigmatarchaeota archaeon]
MKGQLFSLDLMVALTIFLGIVMLAMYFMMLVPTNTIYYGDMQTKANSMASQLTTIEIGTEGNLDCDKLIQIANMSYDDLRRELGAGEYDIWVEIPNVTNDACPSMRRATDTMLIIDVSGSMGSPATKISNARKAAKTFVAMLNGSYDQAGLANFSTKTYLVKQLTMMGIANASALNNSIDKQVASLNTDIAGGMFNATTELKSVRARPGAIKTEVLLTDGLPNTYQGKSVTVAQAVGYTLAEADRAAAAGITIYTISLGTDCNRTLMKQIAAKTGGDEYYAPSDSQLVGIYIDIAMRTLNSASFGQPIAGNITASDVTSIVRVVQLNGKQYRLIMRVYRRA